MKTAGRPLLAVLLLLATGSAGAGTLRVTTDDGVLLERDVSQGEWCLHWSHSVTGGPVADCFAEIDGRMVLRRSFLHDFAAGLGHIDGRGVLRSAHGGGYWIENIDEPLPGNRLILRIGSLRVGHELRLRGEVIDLSNKAAGKKAEILLLTEN